MLSTNDLRKVAARSGARDIGNVEIDVILTYLLQLFSEKEITKQVAFKGGTMLRKMVFGTRGRLSTDLDFTCLAGINIDDFMLMMLDALGAPYNGISFRFDREKDWYLTDEGCAANPVCFHEDNQTGVKIKLQVSTREAPVLPVVSMPQLPQDYFNHLPFAPLSIPCLTFEEAVAEKIRAASQRSKVRDLHDLSEIAARPANRDLIRSLAVLKLWNTGGPGLNYERFTKQVRSGDYNLSDLTSLLRRDQKPDLTEMIDRVVKEFQFLANLNEVERVLAMDGIKKNRKEAENLIQTLRR